MTTNFEQAMEDLWDPEKHSFQSCTYISSTIQMACLDYEIQKAQYNFAITEETNYARQS